MKTTASCFRAESDDDGCVNFCRQEQLADSGPLVGTVEAGIEIVLTGTVGNTAMVECAIGDHLHFTVTQDDEPINPADFFALQ